MKRSAHFFSYLKGSQKERRFYDRRNCTIGHANDYYCLSLRNGNRLMLAGNSHRAAFSAYLAIKA